MPTPRIRRLERLDRVTADAVEGILARAALHGRHSAIGEHKFVRLVEGQPDTFGLLATLGGQPVGFAQATRHARFGELPSRLAAELVVDPTHRRVGVGGALFERLVGLAREANLERFDVWAHGGGAAAGRLARGHGLRVSRRLWRMVLQLDSLSAGDDLRAMPARLRLRRFQSDADEAGLVELVRDAFADHPEYATFDEGELAARFKLPWFDPSLVLLAEEAGSGRLLGLNWMKLDAERAAGEVYLLGVRPRAQGLGIGRVLLFAGLEEMRRRAMRLGFLYVEAQNKPAIALYRDAGFRHEHLDTCYSIDLRPLEPPSRAMGAKRRSGLA